MCWVKAYNACFQTSGVTCVAIVYACLHVCVCVCMRACMFSSAGACVHEFMRVCLCARARVCVFVLGQERRGLG